MKSPSDEILEKDAEQYVKQQVTTALDSSVNNLSEHARDDIFKARQVALRAMHNPADKVSISSQLRHLMAQPLPRAATGVACAALIALSFNYGSVESVPVLPVAMLSEDVPTEALSLLEDLEFVTWLAENEQEALL